jgi:hypothetical protein
MLGKLIQLCLCFVGQQALYPVGVDWHWSVSSVIERETDTPSLEIAETRCPGVQRTTVIVFGGSSVPVVDDTWGVPESTSAIRHPPGRCNQTGISQRIVCCHLRIVLAKLDTDDAKGERDDIRRIPRARRTGVQNEHRNNVRRRRSPG